ncbi:NAD(P)-binding domain-containing protein [Eubacterium sp. 1001713B170207_170306_E7]|uniref:NAD(P)-binding domain-containing protein n=1 Tax=Eubacterium sp. 1001713B170207_170306_E7 TaxID=2787097 RepID=UPI0018986DC0|nr:NAD(P)-binding domain-containing protein [Eubacterium sp. 1001713B170207_170306_E7]
MSVVTLIGSGQMASALTFPLYENGHEVRLVGSPLDNEIIDRLREDHYHFNLLRTLHDGIHYYKVDQVTEALEGADVVVCGVSSFGVDWFLNEIIPIIPEGVPMISVTKGMLDFEDGRLQVYPEYWEEHLPEGSKLKIYAIGGPCTARDLADHDHSFVGFCGRDIETQEKLRDIFATDYYHISLTTDVVGLEAAVALKNGYALGTALAIGLKNICGDDGIAHVNSKAALFQQSVKEMDDLLELVGGSHRMIMFAAGDLDVTVAGGRSRSVGQYLGEGLSMEAITEKLAGQTLEAVVIATRTAKAVKALAKAGKLDIDQFPLLMHVDKLLNEGEKVNIPWKKFQTIEA